MSNVIKSCILYGIPDDKTNKYKYAMLKDDGWVEIVEYDDLFQKETRFWHKKEELEKILELYK